MGGPKEVGASLRQFGFKRTNQVYLESVRLIPANLFLPVFEEPVGQRSVSGGQC